MTSEHAVTFETTPRAPATPRRRSKPTPAQLHAARVERAQAAREVRALDTWFPRRELIEREEAKLAPDVVAALRARYDATKSSRAGELTEPQVVALVRTLLDGRMPPNVHGLIRSVDDDQEHASVGRSVDDRDVDWYELLRIIELLEVRLDSAAVARLKAEAGGSAVALPRGRAARLRRDESSVADEAYKGQWFWSGARGDPRRRQLKRRGGVATAPPVPSIHAGSPRHGSFSGTGRPLDWSAFVDAHDTPRSRHCDSPRAGVDPSGHEMLRGTPKAPVRERRGPHPHHFALKHGVTARPHTAPLGRSYVAHSPARVTF